MFDLSEALDRATERSLVHLADFHTPIVKLAYEAGIKKMREYMAEEIITSFIEEGDPDG